MIKFSNEEPVVWTFDQFLSIHVTINKLISKFIFLIYVSLYIQIDVINPSFMSSLFFTPKIKEMISIAPLSKAWFFLLAIPRFLCMSNIAFYNTIIIVVVVVWSFKWDLSSQGMKRSLRATSIFSNTCLVTAWTWWINHSHDCDIMWKAWSAKRKN